MGGSSVISSFKSIIYSHIAQSVERTTVNRDVTGSSPVVGANIKIETGQVQSPDYVSA